MNERRALALLAQGREDGLAWIIDQYTPYVSAIVWNIVGQTMTFRDMEEVTSDVFVTLWRNREKPRPGQLKGYLGSIARSRAINKLRQAGQELSLEENILALPENGPEVVAEGKERRQAVRQAVAAMGPPDREIFVRYYYYCQTAGEIARHVNLSAVAVRQRLKRGRDRLRDELTKGGAIDEAAYN